MMRLTIERLRAGVVAGTLLLLSILGGVLLYAHHRTRGLLRDLPARLGADIQKRTDGVTYSQTIKGRTVFTVHAQRATQLKDGEAELENAGIVLYGEGDGRADRIYGKSFHYDQSAGVIRATGVVQLDLEAVAPVSAEDRLRFASGFAMPPAGKTVSGRDAPQPVHVTTSDLVYSQSTGVANTAELLRFEYRGMVGEARGASYNARTGFTIFERDIRLSGTENGRAYHLTAQHGELDRAANELVLRTARLDSDAGGAAAKQLSAAVLVVHLGLAGGIEHAEGSGGVEVADGGSSARAPLADLTFLAGNRPAEVRMRGGVQISHGMDESGAEKISGSAAEGSGHFDESGRLASVLLTRDVMVEAVSAREASDRSLTGNEVRFDLANVPGGGRRWVRQITATGSARLHMTQSGTAANTDTLSADELRAQLHLNGTGSSDLDAVSGQGHVLLQRSTAAAEEMSRAATIDASFSADAAANGLGTRRALQLQSAVERGGVSLERSTKKPDGTTERVNGRAREASFESVSDRLTLTGDAVLTQATSTVRADRVVVTDANGDADAYGGVQATVAPATSGAVEVKQEPSHSLQAQEQVHAVAARAQFKHDGEVVTLFGEPGQVARIWRGASAVEAAVLVLHQREGTLDASGDGRAGSATVKTVLANDEPKAAVAGRESRATTPRVVRVESERLHYSDRERQAEFVGAVVLQSADGVLRSRRAVATMSGGGGTGAGVAAVGARRGSAGVPGGALERVVADGGVTLKQPGRLASGQQIVYTATDGLFVLTGTPATPPVVVDEATGSLTGAVLRFYAGDNRVAVEGSGSPDRSGRVHTELRLKQ